MLPSCHIRSNIWDLWIRSLGFRLASWSRPLHLWFFWGTVAVERCGKMIQGWTSGDRPSTNSWSKECFHVLFARLIEFPLLRKKTVDSNSNITSISSKCFPCLALNLERLNVVLSDNENFSWRDRLSYEYYDLTKQVIICSRKLVLGPLGLLGAKSTQNAMASFHNLLQQLLDVHVPRRTIHDTQRSRVELALKSGYWLPGFGVHILIQYGFWYYSGVAAETG